MPSTEMCSHLASGQQSGAGTLQQMRSRRVQWSVQPASAGATHQVTSSGAAHLSVSTICMQHHQTAPRPRPGAAPQRAAGRTGEALDVQVFEQRHLVVVRLVSTQRVKAAGIGHKASAPARLAFSSSICESRAACRAYTSFCASGRVRFLCSRLQHGMGTIRSRPRPHISQLHTHTQMMVSLLATHPRPSPCSSGPACQPAAKWGQQCARLHQPTQQHHSACSRQPANTSAQLIRCRGQRRLAGCAGDTALAEGPFTRPAPAARK